MPQSCSTEMQTNYVEGCDERGYHRPNPSDGPRAVPAADVPAGGDKRRDDKRQDE
jgi:hypothetical protein